jgi:hypothetical protein
VPNHAASRARRPSAHRLITPRSQVRILPRYETMPRIHGPFCASSAPLLAANPPEQQMVEHRGWPSFPCSARHGAAAAAYWVFRDASPRTTPIWAALALAMASWRIYRASTMRATRPPGRHSERPSASRRRLRTRPTRGVNAGSRAPARTGPRSDPLTDRCRRRCVTMTRRYGALWTGAITFASVHELRASCSHISRNLASSGSRY